MAKKSKSKSDASNTGSNGDTSKNPFAFKKPEGTVNTSSSSTENASPAANITATGTNETPVVTDSTTVNENPEANTESGIRVVFSSRGTVTTPAFSILEDGRIHTATLPLGTRIAEDDILIPDSNYFQKMYALPDRNYDRNFFPNKEEVIDTDSDDAGSNGGGSNG